MEHPVIDPGSSSAVPQLWWGLRLHREDTRYDFYILPTQFCDTGPDRPDQEYHVYTHIAGHYNGISIPGHGFPAFTREFTGDYGNSQILPCKVSNRKRKVIPHYTDQRMKRTPQ